MRHPAHSNEMIALEEAIAIVERSAWLLPAVRSDLDGALHHVLRESIDSDVDMPPFDKSTMDGYACRVQDVHEELEVIGTLPAGAWPDKPIGPGQCMKIMTGAPVPVGADAIIVVEQVEVVGEGRVRYLGKEAKGNISPLGEDLRAGDRVLDPGQRLLPQHLAILAASGRTSPLVTRMPRVGILSTGNELTPAGEVPKPGAIRNSNSHQIAAQVRAVGGHATDYGIVRDEEPALRAAFARAMKENDVVLSTGGVSMGDYDLVPGILQGHGLETRLRKVAIQPGKPISFAVGTEVACFGLSGNPVSSFIQFELLVRPFLGALQGAAYTPRRVTALLDQTLHRKRTERMAWLPVAFEAPDRVSPVTFHGSAHILSLAAADGLIAYPVGVDTLNAETPVEVRLLTYG